MKKGLSIISILLGLLVSAPIFLYLLHWILVQLHAGDLQMFLFWLYVPNSILVSAIVKITERMK